MMVCRWRDTVLICSMAGVAFALMGLFLIEPVRGGKNQPVIRGLSFAAPEDGDVTQDAAEGGNYDALQGL